MRFVLLSAILSALTLALASVRPATADDASLQLMHHVNQQRLAHGLKSLSPNAQLTAAAQGHARAMAEGDCFSHVCPGGTRLTDRLARAGYPYRMAAENIAAGMASPKDVVESWMNSRGHRRNILNAEAREAGAGYFLLDRDDGEVRYRHYWTMTFGSRL